MPIDEVRFPRVPQFTPVEEEQTEQDFLRLEQEREALKPSALQGGVDALEQESSVRAMLREARDPTFLPVEGFQLPKAGSERWKELSRDVPSDMWDTYTDAVSDKHLDFIHERNRTQLANEERLDALGGLGVLLRGAVILSDGPAIAAALATDGLVAAHKANRLRRFFTVGGLTAVENAALEGLISQTVQTRDEMDVIYAALAGFTIGGPIGALTKGEAAKLATGAARTAENLDARVANAAGIEGVGKEQKLKDTGLDTQQTLNEIDAARETEIDEALDPDLSTFGEDTAGAAKVPEEQIVKPIAGEQEIPDEVLNAPKTKFAAARASISSRMGSSENPWIRWLGNKVVVDNVGKQGDETVEFAAEEFQRDAQRLAELEFYREWTPAYKEWLHESGATLRDRATFKAQRTFNELVSDHLTFGNSTSPSILRAAKAADASIGMVARGAKEAKVKGFENLAIRKGFLPRLMSHDNIRAMVERFGTGNIEKLIAKGIARASDNLSPDQALRIGKAYFRRVQRIGAGMEKDVGRVFSKDEGADDILRQILKDEGLSDDAIEDVLGTIEAGAKPDPKSGVIPRARRRLDMDETVTVRIRPRLGGDAEEVRLVDLFERDIQRLLGTYTRQITGHTAMAKVGIKSTGEYRKHLQSARAYGIDVLGQSEDEVNRELKRVDFAYNTIVGRPVDDFDPTSNFARGLRTVRDWNFVRLMGQMGFMQAIESGVLLGTAGVRTVLTHVPEMKAMLTRVRETGRLEDNLADEIEVLTGLGTDRIRHQVHTRFDSGTDFEATRPFAEQQLERAKRAVTDISLMNSVNMVLQRGTAKAISQKMLNAAIKNKAFVNPRRLAQLGLDQKRWDAIAAQMTKHTDNKPSLLTGHKLQRLNIEDWTDPQAVADFTTSMNRFARRIIQENDIGSAHEFLSQPTGRILFQFRSFMVNAHEKLALSNLAARDFEAFASFSWVMMTASLQHVVRTNVNAQGLDKRAKRKFLKERLSPDEIAKAAFQNSGFTALLPMAFDTAAGVFGYDPVFAYGRSSGLGSNFISGNPTVDLVDRVGKLGTPVRAALDPNYDFSQRNARDMIGLLWFQNAAVIRNAINAMVQPLPEKSK